jgi:hypothetical protein
MAARAVVGAGGSDGADRVHGFVAERLWRSIRDRGPPLAREYRDVVAV